MYAESGVASRRLTNAQACRTLASLPLLCRPGSRWEYSRSTDVLGRLIEVVSGMTLGEFLATRVTGPLGMVDTAFHAPASEHHRVAEPFLTDPVTGEAVKLFDPRTAPTMESGGGGLVGTAADYVRFMQMMMGGGALDGTRLLGRKTVELMTADHLGDIECDSPLLPPGHGFGLGFAVRLHAGISPMPGSAGLYYWGGIAGTTFWIDPAERLCAVLMLQAPGLRDYYRPLFRDMVYAALA